MVSHTTNPAASPPRRPARDIIDAVVDNMRKNLEPLRVLDARAQPLHRLPPSARIRASRRHRADSSGADDPRAGRGARPAERRSPMRRWVHRCGGDSEPEIRNAAADWQVEFLADPDGDMNEGDLLVDSELVLPARPDLGVGERTRRITTVHTGSRTTTREQTVGQVPSRPRPVSSRASSTTTTPATMPTTWSRIPLTIGRGGIAYPVDVRIASSPDVSREHARIRRDPATGRFFLIDLSSLGTTLNGRHVPKGYDEVDGSEAGKRRRNARCRTPRGSVWPTRCSRVRNESGDGAAPVGPVRVSRAAAWRLVTFYALDRRTGRADAT